MIEQTGKLLSKEPEVKLLAYPQVPPQEGISEAERKIISDPRVIAGESARTCYSSKLFEPRDYLNPKHREITNEVIRSTRDSGHLTTREHINFTFSLSGVSRQLVWSLLHSHPHYNSDQQSQRYVTMKAGNFLVPNLEGEALEIYQRTIENQLKAYQDLSESLRGTVEEEYFEIFPKRGQERDKWQGEITKRAQEVARYVLPIATHTNLYHTVSALTLMRLARSCDQYDVPTEAKMVVGKMVEAVVKEVGEGFLEEIPDPIPLEETPEYQALDIYEGEVNAWGATKAHLEFDKMLGKRPSKLIGYTTNGPQVLSLAVRNVIGLSKKYLNDNDAIAQALDSADNNILGEVINVSTFSNIARALETVSYTFAKKLSHTADSQDQRHRMTPAARPVLAAHFDGEADYITPTLIEIAPDEVKTSYQLAVAEAFDAVNKLLNLGVSFESASYLLPNALSIRLVEQGSLLNFHHKYRMRLCYTAQEEIWRASVDEVEQIERVHPQIGKLLLPPCAVRNRAHIKPFCPEGKARYCGVPAWKIKREQYSRII